MQPIDDLESLAIIIEWMEQHGGILPNRDSSNKQEKHYYAILRRIQNKYSKYLEGFEEFKNLTDENKSIIQEIIDLAFEIDLWDIEFFTIPKNREDNQEINPFEITGILRDYMDLTEKVERIERKSTYEQVIEFLETHDGKLMRSNFGKSGKALTSFELTKEQKEERNLYHRWRATEECEQLDKYTEKPIEEVPEEYREKIARLREFGLGKTTYEQVIEFLERHDGKKMLSAFYKDGKRLKPSEMTKEQKEEQSLYHRWTITEEYKQLQKYAGIEIEEIPEEYREKISKLRGFGLGLLAKKTTYEQVIEFLETHDGKIMVGIFSKNKKRLNNSELTKEQIEEKNLYRRWRTTEEFKKLNEYAGQPIEEVPEEYREKIARLREFGLGIKKSKLSKAKKQRDEAKAKNRKAKELEQQVSEQLEKRGKAHEE